MSSQKRGRAGAGGTMGAPELLGAATVGLGAVSVAFHLTSLLQNGSLARTVMSDGLWRTVVPALGGRIHVTDEGAHVGADVDLGPLLIGCVSVALICWLAGAQLIAR